MFNHIVQITLKGVALAMGVAIIVLNTLGVLNVTTAVPMLGIGLAALSLVSLQAEKTPS